MVSVAPGASAVIVPEPVASPLSAPIDTSSAADPVGALLVMLSKVVALVAPCRMTPKAIGSAVLISPTAAPNAATSLDVPVTVVPNDSPA